MQAQSNVAGVLENCQTRFEQNIEGNKMESDSEEPKPSTFSQPAQTPESEENVDKELSKLLTVEDFLLKSKTYMLDYEKHMFLDTIDSDCLVVTARGIGYERVVLNLLKVYCDPANLIIVINSADYEEKYYRSQIEAKYMHESSTNSNERELTYLMGGIHFISTRILVVDLLKKRIPTELITGIIVLRAHQIIESCQEAFALRLYRQSNKTGFVKAFTNNAEAFTYGYGHIEKVMRNLFVTELFIWPRFHALTRKALKAFEPTVVELHIPMTEKMISIQTNLLDIMNFLVKEIKRINRFVDMQEITVENCVTKRFHKILQAQLDSVWHQLNSQTKLLISDLKVLRSLMISTIYNDAVSLFVTMKRYRSQEYAMNNSGWILLDTAEQIFKTTRERVYNSKDEFEPENCPKWDTLSEILRVEIPNDAKAAIDSGRRKATKPIIVLILCQDSRTCYQLNQYLTQGAEKYLLFTAMKNDVPIKKLSAAYKNVKESDINSIRLHGNSLQNETIKPPTAAGPSTSTKRKAAASTEDANETLNKTQSEPSKKGFLRDRIAKRKEAETNEFGEEDDGNKAVNELDELATEDISEFSLYRESYLLTVTENTSATVQADAKDDSFDITQMTNGTFESFAELECLDITQIIQHQRKPIVCIQTFKTGEDGPLSLDRTLNEIDPSYVIMYHCNVTAIRQIEVYEARKRRVQSQRLKVFFMVHSQTVEEQSYLTSLRREKQAFELIIDTKSKMVIPEHQDGKKDDTLIAFQTVTDVVANTRQAGGQQPNNEEGTIIPRVIVDMREFRSDLPCLIHRRGIQVVPVTITIGDYILTPDICVERKSISDLIGSLNSGRLYTQCIQMTRFYKKAILLIEFDQNKPFHLQGHYMISGESATSNIDITQKLQLLTIHFPRLRIMWSPNPFATAQLFGELKQGKPEPDAVQATALGSDESSKELDSIADRMNTNIYDFLLKLPGITTRNIAKVMMKVKNLKELIRMNLEQLTELLGSEANAKMLWEIIHVAHKPVEAEANEKQFMSKFKRGKGKRF